MTMRNEYEEGRGTCRAPHPSNNDEDQPVGNIDNAETPRDKGDSAASGRLPTKISSLTDVPALRDYFNRIGAEARSLKTAVVREREGKYLRDLATIRVAPDGKIECKDEAYAPTEDEARRYAEECPGYRWPELKLLPRLYDLPEMVREADDKDVFEFRNTEGMIVMLQVRTEKEGERAYIPWTYWDDGQWRSIEPDGPLPLFNAHRLKNAATVFIHEGAKAARHVQWMVDEETPEARDALKAHPWGVELAGAVHLGWIGGALSPHRADWSVLKKAGITRAYIVADNDEVGRSAVPHISRAMRCPTYVIQFGDQFPAGFDLADLFPKEESFGCKALFDGDGRYTGPSFRDCLHPATWLTDLKPNPAGKGRPIAVLRDSALGMWAYAEEPDMFVCTEMPWITRSEAVLNKMLLGFSDVNEPVKLLLKAYQGRSVKLCYQPDEPGTKIAWNGSSAINTHVPPDVKAMRGDATPFLEYLAYMFPNEPERVEVERWIATLIANPSVRMGYALLLISETQGIGKTTLGQDILAPIVGKSNVSFPTESDILSDFNEWISNKRLAIVNEIYSGSSWKAYQKLKTAITDRNVTVNQKYVRQHTIENWCHIFACSNSRRALKVEDQDRRWFVPEVAEEPWPEERFEALRKWVRGDGLRIIKGWAEGYGNYVGPGKHAPKTATKREMIEGSRSEAQAEVAAIAEAVRDVKGPAAVALNQVTTYVKDNVQGRVFDTPYELRKTMTECGLVLVPGRIKVFGRMDYVLVNADLKAELDGCTSDGALAAMIRDRIIKLNELLSPPM